MSKQLLVTLIGFAMMPGLAYSADQKTEMKLVYVDLQKAIQETSTGKKAKKDLEKEFNSKKAELKKKEDDIRKMNEDFEKKAAVLSEETRQKKSIEIQTEMRKFQDEVGKSQLNLQKKEGELTKPILDKLQEIIDKMARDNGYAFVFEKSEQSIVWAKKELDITDAVVKEFEKTAK